MGTALDGEPGRAPAGDARPGKEGDDSGLAFGEGGLKDGRADDEEEVPGVRAVREEGAAGLAEEAAGAIALDGVGELAGGGDAEAGEGGGEFALGATAGVEN